MLKLSLVCIPLLDFSVEKDIDIFTSDGSKKKISHYIVKKKKITPLEDVIFSCFPILRLSCAMNALLNSLAIMNVNKLFLKDIVSSRRHAGTGDKQFSPKRMQSKSGL